MRLPRRIILAALATPALAQSWPARPVRLIIPYGAGNLADSIGRQLGEALAARWGQVVVPENQPGAGGALGVAQLARAPADGYTLAFIAMAALTVTPHLARAPYDPNTDLTPLGGVSVSSGYLAVHPALGVRDMPGFLALARARSVAGDPLFYYSAGSGTVPHLNVEIMARHYGFTAQHVPYRSSAAGLADLVGGRVHFTMDSSSVSLPMIQAGRLVAIATSANTRIPATPDVPLMADVAADLPLVAAWQGLFAPRGIPPEIAVRIGADVAALVADRGFTGRYVVGTDPFPLSPGELAARMRREHAALGQLVATLGLRAE
ncbi:MAG: tripartite tricarboxylate transporter substrate binding protein [Alphaproteobacteria bacterium]|nr:tripartite tricarboxylate transporter substrate binding protein [Alphaproteobacteria bacterium]